jgi:hypothetical protein
MGFKITEKTVATILFVLFVVLSGCTRHQPKAFVSVEKSPMRVIYVDYERDISPSDVHEIVNLVSKTKFNKSCFNSDTVIDIRASYKLDYKDTVSRTHQCK